MYLKFNDIKNNFFNTDQIYKYHKIQYNNNEIIFTF